jgi:hypothetical protein
MFSSNTTQVSAGGYEISRSLRFNNLDSAYLSRTPASAGNRKTWTYSAWVKRSTFIQDSGLIAATAGTPISLGFDTSGSFFITVSAVGVGTTTAVFRDPSAWYHVVIKFDTTQATAANRVLIYINNVNYALSSTLVTQNADYEINNASAQTIGSTGVSGGTTYLSAYLTEVNFIDGQALNPSSFGETNAQTGIWQPKAYSGSYGTNGFYLNFSDNSNTTAATLGKDYSGNGNNWTPNNFSVTAGAGNDSLVDVPTPYGVDTGAGGTVRGNYAVFNSLGGPSGGLQGTLSDGNLTWTSPATDQRCVLSTISINEDLTGKWYCEVTAVSKTSTYWAIGMFPVNINQYSATSAYAQYRSDGAIFVNGSNVATVASYTAGDVIGITYNASTSEIAWYKNNSLQTTRTVSNSAGFLAYFGCGSDSSGSTNVNSINFGQRPFAYTAPSGFKALCTQNLLTPTVGATTATQAGKYFNAVTYTGTGSSLGVTGVGFQPDFVWAKGRSGATDHALYDAVRGVQKQLESNNTAVETTETTGITAFGSDGFTTGALAQLNTSSATYVAWNWKANGAGSSNTAGTITSTVSANTTSGFSVVTYTGTGTNATVGHGLGVAPNWIIVRRRNVSEAWGVRSNQLTGNNYSLLLNTDAAESSAYSPPIWGTASPTSTVFSIGTSTASNQSTGTYVAYCFAPVAGYSAMGSYTGNGSTNGPFVYCGFRPAFLLIKNINVTGQYWDIYDSKRNTYNPETLRLFPNAADAEGSATQFDFLSNGFKVIASSTSSNGNGNNIIYMAFAEAPFKYALAR